MTTVDVVYRYGATPTEPAILAIARLREIYGIRRLEFKELDRTVRIEYDSTRLTEPVVHQLLRRGGLDVLERLQLYSIPLHPNHPPHPLPDEPMQNRSVPTSILLPHLVYRDIAQAIVWLSRAFGFVEHYRYGNPVQPDGAQIHLGDAWIQLTTPRDDREIPNIIGTRTQFLTIFVDDVARHYRHSISRGVRLVEELHETVYGERQYAAQDLDGHIWIFSQHAKDLSPEDWGATPASKE